MRIVTRLAALLLAFALPGCETLFPGFSLIAPDPSPPLPVFVDADALLKAEAPSDPWITPLLTDRSDLTVNLVRVKGRIEPHMHERSDETVYILAGEGDLLVEREWRRVKAGMLVHIPRLVPHAFVNRAPEGTVAISVFTPEFISGDRVPVPFDTEKAR